MGISDAPAWVVAHANTLAQWRGWSRFIALQVPYSLLKRDIERDLLPMAETLGLGVTAWSPLAAGCCRENTPARGTPRPARRRPALGRRPRRRPRRRGGRRRARDHSGAGGDRLDDEPFAPRPPHHRGTHQ
ncbi:aldo/keto reductase [Actinomadura luteofluorescens]|uniref:aldo/keto reductase n=1 Tax=Actinomadura luteofluorescens TaxID=46163 RepID=UPI003628D749